MTPNPSSENKETYREQDAEAIKAALLDDPFLFAKVICGHHELSARSHRPLMYMAAGLTDKLIDILNNPAEQSYVVRKIRTAIRDKHGLDWNSAVGRDALDYLLRFTNTRLFRGGGKSSSLTHPIPLWMATRDPNISIAIISNVEGKAIDFCKQIRSTILSDAYQALFPERIPADPKSDLTESQLKLGGRTRTDKEPTIHAFGHKGGITGYHYDVFFVDDLVGKENRSAVLLKEAKNFLAEINNLANPGFKYPVRRIHIGTRWDEEDDSDVLQKTPHCVTITIPIEHHNEPPDDIFTPGIPTMPEWANELKILEIKQSDMASEEGAVSFRANRWLDPTMAGGRIFPPQLVDAARWYWHEQGGKKWIRIPLVDEKTRKRVYDDNGDLKWELVDPLKLFTVIGWDQSFSEDGDPWGIAVLGQDSKQRIFVLTVATDTGYGSMLDKSLYMDSVYKPKKIGLEGGSMQNTTHWWMDRDRRFRKFKGRLQKVPPGANGKEHRLRNMVAEPMKCNQLYIPGDPGHEFIASEMKGYRPGKKAIDNVIDAIAIGAVVLKKPSNQQDVERSLRNLANARRAKTDPTTGIYIG